MIEIVKREAIYLWYYFDLHLRQILPYYVLGIVLGIKRFLLYVAFVMFFSMATGLFVNLI